MGNSMGSPTTEYLTPQDRRQLEPVLDEFELALEECLSDKLHPDELRELFLQNHGGAARSYLEEEIQKICRERVRGNYIILQSIGHGGMGSVYKVKKIDFGSIHALKEIQSENFGRLDQEELIRRFAREIEIGRRLGNHPNIVQYTDAGECYNGVHFLVMEFIEGEDLETIVRRETKLPPADAAQIIHDTALGLAHAHSNELVHRDIKPSNLMLSRYGVVKILDFGLGRLTNPETQMTDISVGKVLGTLNYLPPERWDPSQFGKNVEEHQLGVLGDIYSLGCTFYFLLDGKPPFYSAESHFEKMSAHLSAPLPKLERKDVPEELAKVLEKCLAKSPIERFHKLEALAHELKPFTIGSDCRKLVQVDTNSSMSTEVIGPAAERRLTIRSKVKEMQKQMGKKHTDVFRQDTTPSLPAQDISPHTATPPRRTWWLILTLVALAAVVAVVLMVVYRETDRKEAHFLVTMPELNGHWWFDEMPWYLPDLRAEVMRSVSDDKMAELKTHSESENVREFYQLLKDSTSKAAENLNKNALRRFAPLKEVRLTGLSKKFLHQLLTDVANTLPKEEKRSATDWHIAGLIHHKMGDWEKAHQAYGKAIEMYHEEEQLALEALCITDRAELAIHRGNYASAVGLSDSVMAKVNPETNPLLIIAVISKEADCLRKADYNSKADGLLSRGWPFQKSLSKTHPLRAFYHERLAWSHLDQWYIADARKEFDYAWAIRKDQPNEYDDYFEFFDRQGMAMAEMLQGESEKARSKLLDVLKDLNEPTADAESSLANKLRIPNIMERIADTYIYDVNCDPDNGLIWLDKAIRAADKDSFKQNQNRLQHFVRLQYKQLVLQQLKDDKASISEKLKKLDKKTESLGLSLNDRSIFSDSRYIANTLIEWENDAGPLLNELDDMEALRFRRDDLLLRLFVAKELLKRTKLSDPLHDKIKPIVQRLIQQAKGLSNRSERLQIPEKLETPELPGLFREYQKKYLGTKKSSGD